MEVVVPEVVVPDLTRALTAKRTTVDSRKRGVTRMWNRARAANAFDGSGQWSSIRTWDTKV